MSEGAFEAKVSAKRETSAGIFITLQVQPDDYGSELATLRVGSALQVGWAEIRDTSVQPIELDPVREHNRSQLRVAPSAAETEGRVASAGVAKPKRKFDELPLPAQAALLCSDARFQAYLVHCGGKNVADEETAADALRTWLAIKSRADLLTDRMAAANFVALRQNYDGWLTTQKYADAIR
jgi:hypothetical protein